jgi:signal transduction histidine kinase
VARDTGSARDGALSADLARLRRRLTLWYAVTLGTIVVALGAGLFVAVRRQFITQLDASLQSSAHAVERATAIRESEQAAAEGPVVDAVAELRIQDRALYLLDARARPLVPAIAPPWIRAAGARALRDSAIFASIDVGNDRTLRVFAVRFHSPAGHLHVAVASADQVELEDQYANLIVAFSAAAFVALVLFAVGGSFLTRKSVEPVARTMDSMRRFMADAAHELRTPLTVLRGRAEAALQNPALDAETQRTTLATIEREAARLGKIVEDLLLLARTDAGAWPVSIQRVFLDDVTSDVVSAAAPLAQRARVALELSRFDEAPVDADPALLHQLVFIVVDNAIKFTPAGGRVDVSVVHSPASGSELRVADTGVGVSAEQIPHLFDRFYRADVARGRGSGDGAGLGLSIAQWIAGVHRASIDFRSDPGRGTVVTIRFPLAARAAVSSR